MVKSQECKPGMVSRVSGIIQMSCYANLSASKIIINLS